MTRKLFALFRSGAFQRMNETLRPICERIADLKWIFALTFVSQLVLSEWFLWNLLVVSQKYTFFDVLFAQPILWLEAGHLLLWPLQPCCRGSGCVKC